MNKLKDHLYAAPKDDRNNIFKIEIWEDKASHFVGSDLDTMRNGEHVNISCREYYCTERDGDASKAGDHFIIPKLEIAVYPLTEDELEKVGLS